MKPIIAIVGRPNVGKSTLFNRITRTRNALVGDLPGVTRDRHYGTVEWDDVELTLVDTGGFTNDPSDRFAPLIRLQVQQALEDADAIVLLLDGKSGISPFDREIADILRKSETHVFYAVNKIDGEEQEAASYDFYDLGVDKIYPVSAEHGYGVADFLDDLIACFPVRDTHPEPELVRLSVIGRPNVGKSSLINRILGEQRLLVSDIPGTTRDSIDTVCQVNGQNYLLIDTAGIRRKGKTTARIEKYSVIKSLRSMDRCDVALVVIDTAEGITDQDVSIAGYAFERGCGCILLLNKWDTVEKDTDTAKRYKEDLKSAAKFLNFAPILTISAKTGLRVRKIFPLVDEVYGQYATRLSTGPLNRILSKAVEHNPPSLHRGKRLKFYYATQSGTKPPTFIIFVNHPGAVHFSYRRYLTNRIRDEGRLNKTPIRIVFKQRSGRISFGPKKKGSAVKSRNQRKGQRKGQKR